MGKGSETLRSLRECLQRNVHYLQTSTLLKTEEWRVNRDRAYADMYAQCTKGLGATAAKATLAERLAPVWDPHHTCAAAHLRTALQHRLCHDVAAEYAAIESIVAGLMDYVRQEQAIVRAACEIQQDINCLLGRTLPTRPLTAATLDLFNQMQGDVERLPYLIHELEKVLGLSIVVTADTIEIIERTAA